ncbi:MAG: tRNA epoxyqueuosine(34) reductase QueG [Myxococcota bacterium]
MSEAPRGTPADAARVEALGLSLGFDLVGIAAAEPTDQTRFLREWLARGYAGEMHYIGRRVEEREDPRRLLERAQSVIAVGFVYDPGERPSADAAPFRVARYAGGDDYHDVLVDRLRAFEAGLPTLADRPVRTRGYVDTGPVQERAHAAAAGLGWVGKNTCLIHPRLGSYLFLGAILTDWWLPAGEPEPDHCGSCRACLDACPTDAFPEPYVLDATRCISYTTIELRGPIPETMRAGQGDWGFGCDLCQEVCPWNQRERRPIPPDPHGLRARIAPRPDWQAPTLAWVLGLDEERWREATRKTALRRTRYQGLVRNALVAAGNTRDPELRPWIERHLQSDDAVLAEHARWALGQLSG